MKKVSIIISAYNTEKYIEKCINSLLNQTYSNLEILLIDDCSTDTTYQIIKKLVENDSRIKIYQNKTNMGLSYSRNLGLKEATGDYISFIDSDDYVPNDFYQILVDCLEDNNSSIAICDMNIIYDDRNIANIISPACNGEINIYNIVNNGLAASACNKLFKKESILYEFSVGKKNEDLAVIFPSLVYADKISYTCDTYYNYVQRENSIQNSKFSMSKFDIFYGVSLTLERLKDQSKELRDVIVYNQLITLLLYVITREKSFLYRRKILKQYQKEIKPYQISKNKIYRDFLNNLNRKNHYYYQLLVWLTTHKCFFLANSLISIYDYYKKVSAINVLPQGITTDDLINLAKKQQNLKATIEITAIIPNYNYQKYLYQRLYSILYQKVKLTKIIILDDCSTDNSREMIDEIVETLNPYIDIEKNYNDVNSGSPFKQWQKGFSLANTEYVWIAEADDYCNENFLTEVTKPLQKDSDILISYTDTAFIDGEGNQFLRSVRSEIDIQKTGHWDHSYINNGKDEIKNYSYLNGTIANVSSAVIKNGNYDDYFALAGQLRQAGDWLFYLQIIQNGKISYVNKALNYYRVHGNNVTSTMKKEAHLKEINGIHNYLRTTMGLDSTQEEKIKERIAFLKGVWRI